MSERVYDRWANICVLVVIASALAFDSGKFSPVVVGTIGGAAAAISVALYFFNQRKAGLNKEQAVVEVALTATEDVRVAAIGKTKVLMKESPRPGEIWAVVIGDRLERIAIESAKISYKSPYVVHLGHHAYRNKLIHGGMWWSDLRWEQQNQTYLSPNEVAECAVQIIQKLSVGEGKDQWEFTLTADGLRVSGKKGNSSRPKLSQVDLDFGEMPTMMVQ